MEERRQLRGATKAEPLSIRSREDRFEAMIRFHGVLMESGSEIPYKRLFRIPNEVFRRLANDKANGTWSYSRVESLPEEVILEILEFLSGNDQIIAALSCRTFAKIVQSSMTPKHANISMYRLPPGDHVPVFLTDKITDLAAVMAPSSNNTMTASVLEVKLFAQWTELRLRVVEWLGVRYRYCFECLKYRRRGMKWWTDFVDYERPSRQEKPERMMWRLEVWAQARAPDICPLHDLMKEEV